MSPFQMIVATLLVRCKLTALLIFPTHPPPNSRPSPGVITPCMVLGSLQRIGTKSCATALAHTYTHTRETCLPLGHRLLLFLSMMQAWSCGCGVVLSLCSLSTCFMHCARRICSANDPHAADAQRHQTEQGHEPPGSTQRLLVGHYPRLRAWRRQP